MKLSVLILFCLVGQCVAGNPCARLAEIIGDTLDWIRYDYNVGQLMDWRTAREIDYAIDGIKNQTGYDIRSSSGREEAVCELLSLTKLKQLEDFVNDPDARPYRHYCAWYKREMDTIFAHYPQLQIPFVQKMYSLAKDFATWLQKSGFPNSFPPSGSHEVNVGALQAIVDEMEVDDDGHNIEIYSIRIMLTELLPIGPLIPREVGYKNHSTVEEVVGWMEDSNHIFTYAGFVKEQNKWFGARDLQTSVAISGLVRNNYDKILWYEEALRIFLESNLLRLDTSDCPEES